MYRNEFRALQTAKRNVWLRIINIKFYCPRWIQVNNFNWIQIFLALRCWLLPAVVPSLRPIVTLHYEGSAPTSFCELFLGGETAMQDDLQSACSGVETEGNQDNRQTHWH